MLEDNVVPAEQEAAPKQIEPPQGDEEVPNADKKEDDTKSRASLASASSKREVRYLGNCIFWESFRNLINILGHPLNIFNLTAISIELHYNLCIYFFFAHIFGSGLVSMNPLIN